MNGEPRDNHKVVQINSNLIWKYTFIYTMLSPANPDSLYIKAKVKKRL